jgi:hypothetical protein
MVVHARASSAGRGVVDFWEFDATAGFRPHISVTIAAGSSAVECYCAIGPHAVRMASCSIDGTTWP